MIDHQQLVRDNNQHLQQTIDLIEQLTDELYCNNESPYFKSGVGKHIRHIIDFYDCFLTGWHKKIDYDARKRDKRFENERQYGIQKIKETVDALNHLPAVLDESDNRLLVKNDESSGGSGKSPFSFSTLERELQFLKFHAVHHFAIIAMILRIQGFELPGDFGVATSTLQYLKNLEREGRPHP
jgi:uncharacterized damage-inducible protein DinB